MPVTSSSWANHVILQAVRTPRNFRCDVAAHKQIFVKANIKVNTSGDDRCIVVVLAQFVSRTFLHDVLQLYNVVLNTRNVPRTWKRCPSCWQASKMHAFRFFGQQQVSTYSSQVKSSDAKPRSRVESSRIQSSQVKSSQVNSSQVKSAAGPTPIREPNVKGGGGKEKYILYMYV